MCILDSLVAPKYSLENSKIPCIQKSLLEIPNVTLSKSQIPAYNLDFPATKETFFSLLKTILDLHPFTSHFQTSIQNAIPNSLKPYISNFRKNKTENPKTNSTTGSIPFPSPSLSLFRPGTTLSSFSVSPPHLGRPWCLLGL